MNKDKSKGEDKAPAAVQEGKVEELFSAVSLDEYAELSRDDIDGGDCEHDQDVKICN